jgi:hypothetical protein
LASRGRNRQEGKPAAAKKPAAKKAPPPRRPPRPRPLPALPPAAVRPPWRRPPAALSAEELAVAERVHTGRIACELGAYVNVTADQPTPATSSWTAWLQVPHVPVKTSTGTVRLEDKQAGAVWLQIANKSMLMNQKAGQRLADECMSPEQQQVAEAIRKNPPPSLLDSTSPLAKSVLSAPAQPLSKPLERTHVESLP